MGVYKYLVKPLHTLNLSAFKPSKPFQAIPRPLPQKMTSLAAANTVHAESLADTFGKMMLEDSIMKALWDGTASWGDILCTPEEEERCRINRERREAEEAAARATRDAELSARDAAPAQQYPRKPRVHYSDAPHKPTIVVEREVPAFPEGRRTLMAKNLPRDIDVKELRAVFEKYGAIRDIYIPKNMDKSSPYFGTIKGFAKIQFLKSDDSATAFAAQYALLHIRSKNIVLEPAAEDR